jgi:hypothetical protein
MIMSILIWKSWQTSPAISLPGFPWSSLNCHENHGIKIMAYPYLDFHDIMSWISWRTNHAISLPRFSWSCLHCRENHCIPIMPYPLPGFPWSCPPGFRSCIAIECTPSSLPPTKPLREQKRKKNISQIWKKYWQIFHLNLGKPNISNLTSLLF